MWKLSTAIEHCRGDLGINGDDDSNTFRILQEMAAYLGPAVLTKDKDVSWKRHSDAYP